VRWLAAAPAHCWLSVPPAGRAKPAGPAVGSAQFGVNATGVVHFWDRNATAPFGTLLVKEFNATHPHLKVELSPIQDTQYVTKLATGHSQRLGPDLVGIDDINSQLFLQPGVSRPHAGGQ